MWWCPQALQRPTSQVPLSHHRWHLVSQHLRSSTCFYQWHIHSSHTCKLFIRTHHTKTPKLNRFALLCVSWNTTSAQMFHLWIFSTWKSVCISTGPFSFMEMNANYQTLNENFKLPFESANQFVVPTDNAGSKGWGIRRHRSRTPSVATCWLCALGQGWISPVWSCSSHLWCS